MGYKRQRKVYRLVFDDPEMVGLEVMAKSVSVGELLELSELEQATGANATAENVKATRELLSRFATALVSWNLEDEDGVAVPPVLNSIFAEDLDFVLTIVRAWMDAVAGVPAPLATPSRDGGSFPEVSLPMETLSESLAS